MVIQLQMTVKGDGPDLVLLHGWGMSSEVWGAMQDRLAERYRVTAIDLPGHGASPSILSTDSKGWGNALLSKLPEKAVWIGWSLGGMLALRAAESAPERISAIVTVASNLRFLAAEDWPFGVAPTLFNEVVNGMLSDPVATLQRFIALQFLGIPEGRQASRLLREEVAKSPPDIDSLRIGLEILRNLDNRGILKDLKMPVQMMFGERDKLVPVSVTRAISSIAPAVEVVRFARAGHAPFLTHPDAFINAVLPFVDNYAD